MSCFILHNDLWKIQGLKQERLKNLKILIEIVDEIYHFEQMGWQPEEIKGSHSSIGSSKKRLKSGYNRNNLGQLYNGGESHKPGIFAVDTYLLFLGSSRCGTSLLQKSHIISTCAHQLKEIKRGFSTFRGKGGKQK